MLQRLRRQRGLPEDAEFTWWIPRKAGLLCGEANDALQSLVKHDQQLVQQQSQGELPSPHHLSWKKKTACPKQNSTSWDGIFMKAFVKIPRTSLHDRMLTNNAAADHTHVNKQHYTDLLLKSNAADRNHAYKQQNTTQICFGKTQV